MPENYDAVVATPFGGVGIRLQDGCVVDIDFLYQSQNEVNKLSDLPIVQEIQDYLKNPTHRWQVDICAQGTAFQKRVWQAMQRIPPGQVKTYGELAAELGTSARAIGNACRANPIPIVIPCHRVVAKNGIGGFGGATKGVTLSAKQWLLKHEGVAV